jgi:hypothetical protein
LPPTLSIACMHMAASPSLEVFKRRIGRACIVPLFRAKQMSSVPPAWAQWLGGECRFAGCGRRYAIGVDAPSQPAGGMLAGREYHVVLEDVVQIDVPPSTAIVDRDGAAAVEVRPEHLLLLERNHCLAS